MLRPNFVWLPVLFGIMLVGGCQGMGSQSASTERPGQGTSASASNVSLDIGTAQFLAIEGSAEIKGKIFSLEIARTPEQQATGLMYRKSLPEDRGMWFPVATPRSVELWMKQTKIPLDMIFVREGRVVKVIEKVEPCQINPCETYPSGEAVDGVLEVVGGTIATLNIKAGDRVILNQTEVLK
jgi:uncharacterized protein